MLELPMETSRTFLNFTQKYKPFFLAVHGTIQGSVRVVVFRVLLHEWEQHI